MQRRLIPLLVLALAGGLFWWTSREGESPRHDVQSDVALCKERLRAIYAGLLAYEAQYGEGPRDTGSAFLGSLLEERVWEDTPENRALLRCPGPRALSIKIPRDEAPARLGSRAAWTTGYTVGDFATLELGDFPSGGVYLRAIVACASGAEMSHEGVLNVLYNDGSVKTFLLKQLVAKGLLPAGSSRIPVGPDSPLEELQLLISR